MRTGKFFLIILLLAGSTAFAQDNSGEEPTGANVLYRKEKLGGALIHSHGFGLFYRNGTHITGTLRRFWEVEAVTFKHPKEVRTSSNDHISRSFVFGKMNAIMQLRGGLGYQRRLHGRDEARGVEVRMHFFAGPSLALAKPVYLNVQDNTIDNSQIRRYDPEQHQQHEIRGRASVLRGLSETRPFPGLYLKSGLAFEYGGNFDTVKGLECGVTVDGYLKKLPVMAFAENPQVIVSLYLAFFIGKRYV